MKRDRLIRLKEVSSKIGMSRSTIYDLTAKGLFPDRVLLGRRAVAWWESEVDAWLATRPRASDESAKAAKSTTENREA